METPNNEVFDNNKKTQKQRKRWVKGVLFVNWVICKTMVFLIWRSQCQQNQ